MINGNMVYLCDVREDDGHPVCHGLGVVRGIDTVTNQLYLITGMDRSCLKNVNGLVLCSIPVPSQVILHPGSDTKGEVPYVCQTGSNSILFRNVIDRPFRNERAMRNSGYRE